jgi:hypothetical protein
MCFGMTMGSVESSMTMHIVEPTKQISRKSSAGRCGRSGGSCTPVTPRRTRRVSMLSAVRGETLSVAEIASKREAADVR